MRSRILCTLHGYIFLLLYIPILWLLWFEGKKVLKRPRSHVYGIRLVQCTLLRGCFGSRVVKKKGQETNNRQLIQNDQIAGLLPWVVLLVNQDDETIFPRPTRPQSEQRSDHRNGLCQSNPEFNRGFGPSGPVGQPSCFKVKVAFYSRWKAFSPNNIFQGHPTMIDG